MLGEHAGDVIVDHYHFVDMPKPLFSEDADGGRAAAHPHALFLDAVHDRRRARADHEARAAVDGQLHRLLVAEREHHVAGHAAFFLAAAGQMMHAAEAQHLRAVFGRRHVTDDLALATHVRLLRPEKAVGVDFYLEAAIAEDALGDDRHHVDAFEL